MISIRNEKTSDAAAREALLDVAYGPVRFTKPSEALRCGRLAAEGLSLVATENGRIVGTVRLWHIDAGGGVPAVLLGPLAVHPDYRGKGLGAALTDRAVRNARMRGHKAVLLVGDPEYYGRFGFTAEKTGDLVMPGDCDAHRLLALELVSGALDGAFGAITAAGKPVPRRHLLPSAAVEGLAAVSHAA
jgi:predicted N-acetyltransferase YhbS